MSRPTTADYARHAAHDNKRRLDRLEDRVAKLEALAAPPDSETTPEEKGEADGAVRHHALVGADEGAPRPESPGTSQGCSDTGARARVPDVVRKALTFMAHAHVCDLMNPEHDGVHCSCGMTEAAAKLHAESRRIAESLEGEAS